MEYDRNRKLAFDWPDNLAEFNHIVCVHFICLHFGIYDYDYVSIFQPGTSSLFIFRISQPKKKMIPVKSEKSVQSLLMEGEMGTEGEKRAIEHRNHYICSYRQ